MKLLTKAIEKKLPALYSQQNVADPVAQVKFFTPWANWSWFATEYDPASGIFFGKVFGQEDELGYFALAELQSVKGPLGLKIERDLWFTPCKLSECTNPCAH